VAARDPRAAHATFSRVLFARVVRALRPWGLDVRRRSSFGAYLDTADVLDEHLLRETIGLADELVVMTLAHVADLLQVRIAQRFARLTERCKRILSLARLDDIANESKEITFTGRVGEAAGRSHRLSDDGLGNAGFGAERTLILFEHSLVLAHLRDDAGAEIAVADVIRLTLVILEVLQQRAVLHRGIADLALEEIESFIHETSVTRAGSALHDVRHVGPAGSPFAR
jgi:hypothetical protein